MKFLKFFTAIFVLSLTLPIFAAETSPAGTWKWTVQGRQGGGQGFEQTLKLDYQDGKLTGTMMGAQGGQYKIPDTAIAGASLKDGVLKFSVTREFNNNTFTTKYEGKLEGDTITGTYERPGMNGEPAKRDWKAKRQQ